ncbi:UDP-glucose/galactose:(glucosyl)LPS alpha-1,2-glucosyl/galactosyltransferase [Enterobacter sp. BIGb0383]|uniref:glycosyltransferase family 8 protein n=1 Tax=unclassified Enterobacter TaxID=2608935 RepID=UPI000F46FC1A|nr:MULTISPECIES: glycosyltransferase [unclassified Enterobacter]ROP56232.1 UDP-glucose/galactose:(glucosyl)LPS alpha-1,2-glucosyl/galactosyltransferase [Enterobacter sp. BIGb0383]ROS05970.1 UDP-glucose/galactose:(glucosyl)LPS alpha-1,2-glucosyl/galactosyltransferase [Enterobacter sp. BIGb0359]
MNIDFQEIIIEKHEFNSSVQPRSKKINVAYGVDRNFLFGTGISMTSVLVNNADIDVHFYIATDYIDNDYLESVERLTKMYSTTVTILVFDNEAFRKLPSTKSWTYAMYYRYFAFEYLCTTLSAVLYLDADVICKGSLRELADINFHSEYAAVINDIDEVRLKSGSRLGIPELNNGYFNSGVVFANLDVWKEKNLLTQAFSILQERQKDLLYFDQDVLNILFVGHTILLRRDFNCIYGVDQELKNKSDDVYQDYINDDTVLIHYVGVTKPWHTWAKYPVAKFFIEAYEKSAWAEKSLLNATSARLYKRKSRHERIQRKYIRSILSHLMYIKAKLSKAKVN